MPPKERVGSILLGVRPWGGAERSFRPILRTPSGCRSESSRAERAPRALESLADPPPHEAGRWQTHDATGEDAWCEPPPRRPGFSDASTALCGPWVDPSATRTNVLHPCPRRGSHVLEAKYPKPELQADPTTQCVLFAPSPSPAAPVGLGFGRASAIQQLHLPECPCRTTLPTRPRLEPACCPRPPPATSRPPPWRSPPVASVAGASADQACAGDRSTNVLPPADACKRIARPPCVGGGSLRQVRAWPAIGPTPRCLLEKQRWGLGFPAA